MSYVDLNRVMKMYSVYSLPNQDFICWLIAENRAQLFDYIVKSFCFDSAQWVNIPRRHDWIKITAFRGSVMYEYEVCYDGPAEPGVCYFP